MWENLKRSFVFHLVIVLSLCVLLFGLFFAALHMVTAHGKEQKLPGLKGKDINTALKELKALNLENSVLVLSVRSVYFI